MRSVHIDEKKDEIDESLRHIVQKEDKGIQKIIAKLNELRESGELPELKENEKKHTSSKNGENTL